MRFQDIVCFFGGGCCTGISIILAQLYGSGEAATFRKESFVAFYFGTGNWGNPTVTKAPHNDPNASGSSSLCYGISEYYFCWAGDYIFA